MLNYLFRRLNLLFITAFILTIIAFVLTHWSIDNRNNEQSYLIQYFNYLLSILQGDWGVSSIDGTAMLSRGLNAFASTLELCFIAFFTATTIAVPLGVFAGLNRSSFIDYVVMTIALVGSLLGFSLPIDGSISPIYEVPSVSGFLLVDCLFVADLYQFDAFLSRLAHLVLPASVLSFFLITEVIRLTRYSISVIMKSNHIKAAYAKGLSIRQIVFRHVLKNALPAIIHQLRLQLSTIISFAMVIEIVFSLNGAGPWVLNSIKEGDYLALPTALLLISAFILFSGICIDILLMVISPIKRKSLYVD